MFAKPILVLPESGFSMAVEMHDGRRDSGHLFFFMDKLPIFSKFWYLVICRKENSRTGVQRNVVRIANQVAQSYCSLIIPVLTPTAEFSEVGLFLHDQGFPECCEVTSPTNYSPRI